MKILGPKKISIKDTDTLVDCPIFLRRHLTLTKFQQPVQMHLYIVSRYCIPNITFIGQRISTISCLQRNVLDRQIDKTSFQRLILSRCFDGLSLYLAYVGPKLLC